MDHNNRRMVPTRSTCISVVTKTAGIRHTGLLEGCFSIAIEKGWVVQILDRYEPVLLRDWKPDGLLVFEPCPWAIDWARHNTRPLISVCMDGDDGIRVDLDDHEVGKSAARFLLERGLRSFAGYGIAGHEFSRKRLDGFRAAVLAEGAKYDSQGENWDPEQQSLSGLLAERYPHRSQATLGLWLKSLPKPTGIFAACDFWGLELENSCLLNDIRVPEECAILGVDDDPLLCNIAHPPLTSVAIPWQQAGQRAAVLLSQLMTGETPPEHPLRVAPLGVTPRRSTDIFDVDDPDVAAALAVIHAHSGKSLTVGEILRRVPAYQHRLERGFRRLLGRSMLQEIARVHVERAKHLIVTTDLSMAEIANRSGFSNARRLAEAFREHAGMTPTEYRFRFGAFS
jgi:LacI family transcriptional regulator